MFATEAAGAGRPLAFLISTTRCAQDIRRHMGSADYSYVFVLNALRPVLEQLGTCRLIDSPESSLAQIASSAEAEGFRPVHLALQPPHSAYFTPAVPTILFPFWEFPDVPGRDFGFDTRQNWQRLCRPAAMILTACEFTAAAIRRAGAACPVAVVPVPLGPEPFETPAWDPAHSWTVDCRHLVLGGESGEPSSLADATVSEEQTGGPRGFMSPKEALRGAYRRYVRPWLSPEAILRISEARKSLLRLPETPPPVLPRAPLTLSGLVYTSIFNLSDRRKNAADLLSAFLLAFRDRPDVTLVLKLATSPTREYYEMQELGMLYHSLGLEHRCRIAIVTDYLDDAEMAALFRATAFYVNTSRAEGACLPLQQALASGRPALAPLHTAMADYMDEQVGFPLESNPEPTFWPHDPDRRCETRWHRLVWTSLRDAFLASAEVALADRARYDAMAASARDRMARHAGREVVAEALGEALRRLPPSPVGALDWVA
jgi:glycosyltransferase involved in cell wall biosynthesis